MNTINLPTNNENGEEIMDNNFAKLGNHLYLKEKLKGPFAALFRNSIQILGTLDHAETHPPQYNPSDRLGHAQAIKEVRRFCKHVCACSESFIEGDDGGQDLPGFES